MPCLRSFWLRTAILVAGAAPAFAACPAKIALKLCPIFEAAADSAYLQVRIVLDPKVESSFVWDKSHGPQTRPLRIYSDSLIAKYDLRRMGNPDSAYVPFYAPQDFSPANEEVLYHNASVTKANVGRLINEAYVATVEPGCGYRLATSLCTEINTQPDSVRIFISIRLNGSLQTDSVAHKAYLSKYDVRDTSWKPGRLLCIRLFGQAGFHPGPGNGPASRIRRARFRGMYSLRKSRINTR